MVPSLPAHNLRNDGPQRQNEKLSNMSDFNVFAPVGVYSARGNSQFRGLGRQPRHSQDYCSNPVLSETVLTAPCDNQVIEQPNIEQRGRLGNFLRENLILLDWARQHRKDGCEPG